MPATDAELLESLAAQLLVSPMDDWGTIRQELVRRADAGEIGPTVVSEFSKLCRLEQSRRGSRLTGADDDRDGGTPL